MKLNYISIDISIYRQKALYFNIKHFETCIGVQKIKAKFIVEVVISLAVTFFICPIGMFVFLIYNE